VTARVDDAVLAIEVRDDGVGGADPQGAGLIGIPERVDALGGRLRIESQRGTILAAELSLPSDGAANGKRLEFAAVVEQIAARDASIPTARGQQAPHILGKK
jgi:signal transduction histidine kinase